MLSLSMPPRSPSSGRAVPRDLQPRLVSFAVDVCRLIATLPRGWAMDQNGDQLIRSAGSVAANYAEARAAESRRDFLHKMQICLKELRESSVWLEILGRLRDARNLDCLSAECEELTRIFVTSIKTAKQIETDC